MLKEGTKKIIIEMLKASPSLSYKSMGDRAGVSWSTVAGVARRNNLQHGRLGVRRFTSKKKRQWFNEDKVIACVQAHPDMTYREIAEVFNLKTHQVGNLVYRRGVKRNKVGEEATADKKKLVAYVIAHPEESYSDIGREFGLPTVFIGRTARENGVIRGKGQGPRHNSGRKGVTRTVQQREHLSDVMSEVWSRVSPKHKDQVSRIMKSSWDDTRKKQMRTALKAMWKEANQGKKA